MVVSRWLNPRRLATGDYLPVTLHNRDVPVDGKVGKSLCPATGKRPLHFQPIDLRPGAEAQHNPRVVIRQVASTANFHAASFQIARLVRNSSADSIGIRLLADQFQPEPVILTADVIA